VLTTLRVACAAPVSGCCATVKALQRKSLGHPKVA
jgi:hypothetical protein